MGVHRGTPTTRERLRPLQTLWFDTYHLRLMGQRGPHTKLIFDELAALHKLCSCPPRWLKVATQPLSCSAGLCSSGSMGARPKPSLTHRRRNTSARRRCEVSRTGGGRHRSAEMERIEESRQEGWRRSGPAPASGARRSCCLWTARFRVGRLRGILKVRNFVTTLQIPLVCRRRITSSRATASAAHHPRATARSPPDEDEAHLASIGITDADHLAPAQRPTGENLYQHEFAAAKADATRKTARLSVARPSRRRRGLLGASSKNTTTASPGKHPFTGEPLSVSDEAHHHERGRPEVTDGAPRRLGCDVLRLESASLTALVAGDEEVSHAHDAAVRKALDVAVEPTPGAHWREHPPETTAKMVAAVFQHNSARPVVAMRRRSFTRMVLFP